MVRYHADGPEGQQVVVLLAITPGVPAGVLALLQDEHFTREVYLLKAHKAGEGRQPFKSQPVMLLTERSPLQELEKSTDAETSGPGHPSDLGDLDFGCSNRQVHLLYHPLNSHVRCVVRTFVMTSHNAVLATIISNFRSFPLLLQRKLK